LNIIRRSCRPEKLNARSVSSRTGAAREVNSPFPIFCCSIALRDQPVREAARQIAGAGFAGMELWYPHIEQMGGAELKEIREMCRALGLAIGVLSPYFSFTRGRERWEQSIRTAAKALEAADLLGVEKIRTFIDCGPDGLGSQSAGADDWKAAIDGLGTLCAMGPETQFVVETHEDTLADTLPSTRRIVDEVARPNLRLNYQPTRDFLQRGYLKCLEDLYPAVSHMHWEQIRDDGSSTYVEEEGVIDFAALIAFLRGKKYRGTASVEYCWTPVDLHRLPSAAQFLDRLCREANRDAAGKVSADIL
jgi:sugar phosphate isomerase/epimerase